MNEGSGYSLDFEDASHTGDFIEKASKTASKWQIFQINVKHRKTIFVAFFVVCIYALSFLHLFTGCHAADRSTGSETAKGLN